MSTITQVIPVPLSGFGVAVDVSSMVGPKTVFLTGRFRGSYVLYGSHVGGNLAPLFQFDAGGVEGIRLTLSGALATVALKSMATDASGVSASISGESVPGNNTFAVLGTLSPGDSGPQPSYDLGVSNYQEGLNFILTGGLEGKLAVEGSSDNVGWNPIGQFSVDPSGTSLLASSPGPEFVPLATDDMVRYVRLNVIGRVVGGLTVTVGGSKIVSGGSSVGTLSQTYQAGANAVDQSMVLLDSKGGKVTINSASATFTDPVAFQVDTYTGVGAAFKTTGGMILGPVNILVELSGSSSNVSGATSGVSIGSGNTITGQGPVAIGPSANASGDASISVGSSASSYGRYDIAIGNNAMAGAGSGAPCNIAIGNNVVANTDVLPGFGMVSVGVAVSGYGNGSVVVGSDSTDYGDNNVLVGSNNNVGTSIVSYRGCVAIGLGITGIGDNTVMVGNGALTDGVNCIAIGNGAHAQPGSWGNGIAIGNGASVPSGATFSIAIGSTCEAKADTSFAIGASCVLDATATFSVGVGRNVHVFDTETVAIGNVLIAEGARQVLIGTQSHIDSSANCIAIGDSNILLGPNTGNMIAIGQSLDVTGLQNAVVLGSRITFAGSGQGDDVLIGSDITFVGAVSLSQSIVIGGWNQIGDGGLGIIVGYGSSIGDHTSGLVLGRGASVAAVDLNMTYTCIAIGLGAIAADAECVIGHSDPVVITNPAIRHFVVRGMVGVVGSVSAYAIDTISAISEPTANNTGLTVTYNDGITISNKLIQAGDVGTLPLGAKVLFIV
jgi:hypothetical protein